MTSRRAPMPLLCQLGWHTPESLGRWNDGYYFSRCRRCGRDLVRTLYGRWEVPRGFRVVWRSSPPKSHVSARLIPEPLEKRARVRRSNAPSERELPIQEVLRHLQQQEERQSLGDPEEPARTEPVPVLAQPAELVEPPAAAAPLVQPASRAEVPSETSAPDGHSSPESGVAVAPTEQPVGQSETLEDADEAETAAPPPTALEAKSEPETSPTRASQVPDFMADWPATTDWEYIPTARRHRAEAEAAVEPPAPAASEPPSESVSATMPSSEPSVAPVSEDAPQPAAAAADEGPAAWLKPRFARLIGADGKPRLGPIVRPQSPEQQGLSPTAALLALALPLLFMILVLLLSRGPSTAETASPPLAPATPPPAPVQSGFVTASLLNCRSAPARQAAPVRRLARGDAVQMLARDGEWTSIVYRGEQCWALSRYLASERPA